MKINKSILALLLLNSFIFCKFDLISQQLPQYTQWASHQFLMNPAHAGIKNCMDIHSLYRMQWLGFEGAPKSGFLTLSTPLGLKRKTILSARQGIGARIETDNIGQFSSTRVNVAFSNHYNFTPDTRLSLGISAGFVQFGYNTQNSITINPDPTVTKTTNFTKFDATFGAWWNGKNYYFGLILPNLIHAKWENIGSNSKFRSHIYMNSGYRYNINKKYTFLPSVLLKIPPAGPLVADFNLLFDYQNQFGIGVGYRNTDALLFLANFKIKQQFSVHYSFDFVLSPLRKGTVNTHEISITYTTCKAKNTKTTACSLFE